MLGVFPRLKIVHTDAAAEGQIYIPQVGGWASYVCGKQSSLSRPVITASQLVTYVTTTWPLASLAAMFA